MSLLENSNPSEGQGTQLDSNTNGADSTQKESNTNGENTQSSSNQPTIIDHGYPRAGKSME